MIFEQDIIQRVKVAGLFVLQSYKVLTGTMLSIFIPQNCDDKICTLKENYNNSEVYHQGLFYWNAFSMFMFVCSYLIELRREEWCVKYLDIDNDYPDNCLKEIIMKEKKLDRYMDKINARYYNIIRATAAVYFVNLGLTMKMLNDNYHSSSTLSCFVSFSLLVMMKLYNSTLVAYESVKNDKMMSAYMSEFVSFNVLDQDYLEQKHINETQITICGSDKNNVVKEEDIIPVVKP
jgi:hypothetical protein